MKTLSITEPWPGTRSRADQVLLARTLAELVDTVPPPDHPALWVDVLQRPGQIWPGSDRLNGLRLAGLAGVRLQAGGVDWTDADTAGLIHLLAAAVATGVAVSWTTIGGTVRQVLGGIEIGQLTHLAPPAPDETDPDRAPWTSAFGYARFSWRLGPGFVTVDDRRSRPQAHYVIDDPALLAPFFQLASGGPLPRHSLGAAQDAIEELIEAGLVLQCGEQVVLLPYRLRRWPIPNQDL